MKICVIEDNAIDLKLLCVLLEASGDEITCPASPEQALETIRTERPDVLVLDLNLGAVDGLNLVRQLRNARDAHDIPVLAVTAYPNRYTAEQLTTAGCDAWIVKPIDTRTIVDQVRKVSAMRSGSPQQEPADHR